MFDVHRLIRKDLHMRSKIHLCLTINLIKAMGHANIEFVFQQEGKAAYRRGNSHYSATTALPSCSAALQISLYSSLTTDGVASYSGDQIATDETLPASPSSPEISRQA